MVQVNVKVDKETKKEWEDYIESESDVNTKSGLIRLAVAQYIYDSDSGGSLDDEILNEMKEGQEDIRKEINALRDKLEVIRNEVVRESEEMRDIAYDVLEHIPTTRKKGKLPAEIVDDKEGKSIAEYFADRPKPVKTISELSSETQYDERNVSKAVNMLIEEVDGVRKTVYNGKEVVYRV
jgi:hypothetical protein